LLIAIFALLLISVVAIALLISSGTDSALASNYRSSGTAYYAALAGLEEGRGRLLLKNPDYINKSNTYSNLMAKFGLPTWSLSQVLYITNPAPGETVDPTSTDPTQYPDTEYAQEFSAGLSAATVQMIPSVVGSSTSSAPSYKWVRYNAITETSIHADVNGNGVLDNSGALFYDPANPGVGIVPAPGLLVSSPASPPSGPTPTSVQALEITALAVTPGGGRRLLQYIVAPDVVSTSMPNPPTTGLVNLNFPAALTLAGSNVNFSTPDSSSFTINGQDACSTNNFMVPSVGFTNSKDNSKSNILAGMGESANFLGYPPVTGTNAPSTGPASIQDVSTVIRPDLLTPSGLDLLVRDITSNADAILDGTTSGPAHGTNLPGGMSPATQKTIVVNGNLDLTNWHGVGYGLLVVTGTLTYDPDATWEGTILVIGQGVFVSTKTGANGIDGAVFVARTRDSSGNLLSSLGTPTFSLSGSGANYGRGITYNSCLISGQSSGANLLTYKILSFRELPLNN